MSELKFDEDLEWQEKNRSYWDESQQMPTLVRVFMKFGLERRQAYYFLFGILVVCLFATFEVIRHSFFARSNGPPKYLEDIPKDIKKTLPPAVLKTIPSRNP